MKKRTRIKGPRAFRHCAARGCKVTFYGQHVLCRSCRQQAKRFTRSMVREVARQEIAALA